MTVTAAVLSDVDQAALCLTAAFAQDPITGFLLQEGPEYPGRLMQFFSLLMRARITLQMPVLITRGTAGIQGAAMGYTTLRPTWPRDIAEQWNQFEKATPGFAERHSVYEEIAKKFRPPAPHYYLGAIGVDPSARGLGIGMHLLKAFCDRSATDHLSCGVYLETAVEANLSFYERAGFAETGRGTLGGNTLWCMYYANGKQGSRDV